MSASYASESKNRPDRFKKCSSDFEKLIDRCFTVRPVQFRVLRLGLSQGRNVGEAFDRGLLASGARGKAPPSTGSYRLSTPLPPGVLRRDLRPTWRSCVRFWQR